MTGMDENDITDAELAEMWNEAEPVALEHRVRGGTWLVSQRSQTVPGGETAFTLRRGLALPTQHHAANRPAATTGS